MYLKTYVYTSFGFGLLFLVLLLTAVVILGVAALKWSGPSRNRWLKLSCILFISAVIAFAIPHILLAALGIVRQELTAESFVAVRDQLDEKARKDSVLEPGAILPSFEIETLDGSSFSLVESKDAIVLINFFQTDCGPCLSELPVLQEIWEAYGGRPDFRMIAISRGEAVETVLRFVADHKLTMPIAVDADRSVYSLFAKQGIPRTYLAAVDGRLMFMSLGFMDNDKYGGDATHLHKVIQVALSEK